MIQNIEEHIRNLLEKFLDIQPAKLRIGAICLGGLGDTLDFWAWLAGCRRMFPDAEIVAYTGNGRDNFDALMGKYSPADTAFPFKRHIKFWRFFRGEVLNSSWLSFVRSERQHYDILFDLRPYGAGIYTEDLFMCPSWFEKAYHQMLSHHTAELSSLGLNIISLRNLATGMDGTYDDIRFPLEEYPLPDSPYVTIHHGGCAAPKLWYPDYWEEVVQWLKSRGVKALQLGRKSEERIAGAVDLRNKTTLEQTAFILKNSSHHLDCEGSLVRLAQCGNIQTKCTVLGGATQKALFSFPQNNNLWLDICPPCAYLKPDFFKGKCARRYEGEEIEHCCMRKLTPDIVIGSISKELKIRRFCQTALPESVRSVQKGELGQQKGQGRESDEWASPFIPPAPLALLRLDGLGGTLTLSNQAKKIKERTGMDITLIIRHYPELFDDNPYVDHIITVGRINWDECLEVYKSKFTALADIRMAVGKWYDNTEQTGGEQAKPLSLALSAGGTADDESLFRQDFVSWENYYSQFPLYQQELSFYGLHHIQLTDKILGLPYDTIESKVYFDLSLPEWFTAQDYICICPGVDEIHEGKIQTKGWPHWEGLVKNIDMPVIQLGTKYDKPIEGTVDYRGKTTIKEAAAILSRASVVVTVEGGLMHLAYAAGQRNVIVLFGPTSGALFLYPGHVHIDAFPCRGCFSMSENWAFECKEGINGVCMQSITPERVIYACNRLLGRQSNELVVTNTGVSGM